jgi:hypothetical protein
VATAVVVSGISRAMAGTAAEMASVVVVMAGEEADVELEQIVVIDGRRRSLRILTVAVVAARRHRVACCSCMCRRLLELSACSVPCCRLIWMRYI